MVMADPYVQFQITTGAIFTYDTTGTPSMIGSGYSGAPGYIGQPTDVGIPDKGPIPPGWYGIGADTGEKGPLTLPLTPDPETVMYGRSGFLIHGANAAKDVNGLEASSEGCIVAPHDVRAICATFTRLLVVP